MPRRRLTIIVSLCVIVGMLGGVVAARWHRGKEEVATDNKPPSILSVDPKHLNIGSVWLSDKFEWQLPITNRDQGPVTLQSLDGDCSCATLGPLPLHFIAGETKVLHLALDFTRWSAVQRDDGEPYRLKLKGLLHSEYGSSHVAWQIIGRIKPSIRSDSDQLPFGLQSVRQQGIERSITLTLADGIDHVECEPSLNWIVQIIRDPASNSPQRLTVTVRSRGLLVPRRIVDAIHVVPVTAAGVRLPAKRIALSGELVRDVVPTPRSLHLGRRLCGTTASEAVRLDSLTAGEFRLIRIESSDAALTVMPAGESEGVRSFTLALACGRMGNQQLTATFVVAQDGEEFSIPLPVQYEGSAEGV